MPSPRAAVKVGDGVARSGKIESRIARAYALLVNRSIGACTKAGSPNNVLRSMKARRNASATSCAYIALPNGGSVGHVSRMLSDSIVLTPPLDDGGIAIMVSPRYEPMIGSRHSGT